MIAKDSEGKRVVGTIVAALVLAAAFWEGAAPNRPAPWPVAIFMSVMVFLWVHEGLYWEIFPRGHGYWTANRVSALALLIGAIFIPVIVRAAHWRLVGRARWLAEVRSSHR